MNHFEVVTYEGNQVGYEIRYESLDLMDCYEYVNKWCQNMVWSIHGPDFHDKSDYTEDELDYNHALRKYG